MSWRAVHPRRLWARATGVSRFGSALALTFAVNVFIAGMGMLSGVLSARLLGPAGRGELAAIQTWPQFFAGLAPLGLGSALAYYCARRPQEAGRWLSTALVCGLGSSLLFMAAGYWLMPGLLGAQPAAVIAAAREYLWYVPLLAGMGMLTGALRGRSDLAAWNLYRSLAPAAWVAVIGFHLLVQLPSPARLARSYLLVLAAVLVAAGVAVVRRQLPRDRRPSPALVKPLTAYGLPVVLSSVPATLNVRLDQMLLAGLIGPQALGLYVVGAAWGGAGSMFINTLIGTAFPRVAGVAEPQAQARALAQVVRLGLLLSVSVMAATLLATPLAVPLLFGREFAAAVPVALVLVMASGASGFNALLVTCVMGLGRPQLSLASEVVGLAATAGLLWLLLPRFGLLGAACALLLGCLLATAALAALVVRQTRLGLRELLLPARADAALLVALLRAVKLRAAR